MGRNYCCIERDIIGKKLRLIISIVYGNACSLDRFKIWVVLASPGAALEIIVLCIDKKEISDAGSLSPIDPCRALIFLPIE